MCFSTKTPSVKILEKTKLPAKSRLILVLILAKGEKTLVFCDWLVVTVGIGNYRHGSLM
jgi:hypothetical protein